MKARKLRIMMLLPGKDQRLGMYCTVLIMALGDWVAGFFVLLSVFCRLAIPVLWRSPRDPQELKYLLFIFPFDESTLCQALSIVSTNDILP